MGYSPRVDLIKQGEPVSPGTPNRPLSQLAARSSYLKDRMDAAEIGSTVFARDVTVESEAAKGMAVYFDAETQTFRRALAIVETDASNGVLVTASSADVWGVVYEKTNATKADLLLFGYAPLDLSAAVDGDPAAGTYYLSGVTPGQMVAQRPSVSVPVLRYDGNGMVFVNTRFVDFLDSHRHFRFELLCRPAGDVTPPAEGNRHEITDADSDLPGWLPADNAVFNGLAPAGAVFGYNISKDPALLAAWPPLPIDQAVLDWQKTDPEQGSQGVPLGPDGLVVFDRNGIWWLSDCYGDVPWPVDLNTSNSVSVSDSVGPECPRMVEMTLTLWFTKPNFVTDATVVTSLQSRDARIKVYCRDTTTVGGVGDLDLDLDLGFSIDQTEDTGYSVFKTLDDDKFNLGYVMEGLYALTENVQLTSPQRRRLIPGDDDSPWLYQGPVGITVLEQSVRELDVQLVKLMGATEESTPILYLGLPDGNPSGLIARFDIPDSAPSSGTFAYRIVMIGRTVGTLPPLAVSYNKLSRPPDGLDTPVLASSTFTAMTITTNGAISVANQCLEAQSNAVAVSPGDTIFIKVERDPTDVGDGYAGEMGIVRQAGVLTLT
jgi:hypothetical protein